jgi:hypothetical protein
MHTTRWKAFLTFRKRAWLSFAPPTCRMPLSCPLGLYLLRQIDRATHADVIEMSVEEAARCAATAITQHFEEIVVRVELTFRIERLGGVLERDPVHVNAAVLARP